MKKDESKNSNSAFYLLGFIGIAVIALVGFILHQSYYLISDKRIKGQTMEDVADRISDLVNDCRESLGDVSIYVYDLTDDKEIYGLNIDKPLRPGSNLKLLTALTATEILSSQYRSYSDSLIFVGTIDNRGTATGCFHLSGGYDPLLKDFDEYARALKARGVSSIYGNIVLHLKEENRLSDKGLKSDNIPLLYRSHAGIQKKFNESLDKEGISHYFHNIDNSPSSLRQDEGECIHVITHSLQSVVKDMLKDSNSGLAETILYCLSKDYGDSGTEAIKYHIGYLFPQIDPNSYNIADGSGLSLDNRVCTRLIVQTLRHISITKHNQQLFINALPKAGISGTLKDRMTISGTQKNLERKAPCPSAFNNVIAKTGTLYDEPTSALSGYCTARNGHKLAFSIICNGDNANKTGKHEYVSGMRDFQDILCEYICR